MGRDRLRKAAATAATSPPTVPIIREGTIAVSFVFRKVHVTAAEPTASNKKKSVRRTTPSSVIGWMSAPVTGVANVELVQDRITGRHTCNLLENQLDATLGENRSIS